MEISFFLNLDYLAYLILGVSLGFMVTLGVTGGPTSLERAKEDVEIKKDLLRMRAEMLKPKQRG
jgi:hypothetical protein